MNNVKCYNCNMREASPFLCSHCQWSLVENKDNMKKISILLEKLHKKKLNNSTEK